MTPHQISQLVDRQDPVILDVGCNDGEHTQIFLNLFSESRIFCFEPDPRAIQRFKMSVRDPRACLFEMAVGASDSDGALFYQSSGWPSVELQKALPGGWDLSGSLRKPANHLVVHPWCTFDHAITVKTRRLDTWAIDQDVRHVDFLWMDVQGAEYDVMIGGSQTLAQTRYCYTEYSNDGLYEGQRSLTELTEVLEPWFVVKQVWENDVLFQNKDSQ